MKTQIRIKEYLLLTLELKQNIYKYNNNIIDSRNKNRKNNAFHQRPNKQQP